MTSYSQKYKRKETMQSYFKTACMLSRPDFQEQTFLKQAPLGLGAQALYTDQF